VALTNSGKTCTENIVYLVTTASPDGTGTLRLTIVAECLILPFQNENSFFSPREFLIFIGKRIQASAGVILYAVKRI